MFLLVSSFQDEKQPFEMKIGLSSVGDRCAMIGLGKGKHHRANAEPRAVTMQ